MIFISLLLLAGLGLFAHWAKKYGRGQSKASFKDYMRHYKKQSVASVATTIAAVVTIYTTSDFADGVTGQLAGLAFLAGYVGDSAVNKGPGE